MAEPDAARTQLEKSEGWRYCDGPSGHLVAQGSLGAGSAGTADQRIEKKGFCFATLRDHPAYKGNLKGPVAVQKVAKGTQGIISIP